jgi:plastocyanin
MKKIFKIGGVVVGVVILAGAGFVLYNSRKPDIAADCMKTAIITYSSNREFTPSCIRVSSGETITYINQSANQLEVAIDPHPVHTGNKEVSNGSFALGVDAHASATTVVTTKGTFGIHDHAHFISRATIVVE